MSSTIAFLLRTVLSPW